MADPVKHEVNHKVKQEGLRAPARKELDRVKEILKNSGLKPVGDSRDIRELLSLVGAYYSDGEHFYLKGQYLEAFEAAIISWAYIDSALHLGRLAISEKYREWFTF